MHAHGTCMTRPPWYRTYNAALSELLHFHDCALPASTAPAAGRGRAATAAAAAAADGRSRPLQAALLSLSQLHVEHGHMSAATTALLEAVDVDQGSGDAAALVMCLLQLCVIMRATPPFDHDRGAAKSPTAMMQVRRIAKHLCAAAALKTVPPLPPLSSCQRRLCSQSWLARAPVFLFAHGDVL